VVIDLTEVTFLDSSGLSCLVQCPVTTVRVVAPATYLAGCWTSPASRNFDIFETVDAALRAVP